MDSLVSTPRSGSPTAPYLDDDSLATHTQSSQERTVRAKQNCVQNWMRKNPGKATALKYAAITSIVLAIIGGLVAMAMTGQFNSTGWLRHTALPAIGHWINATALPAVRKFMDMKANLSIGQGLAYIGAPLAGAGVLLGLGIKFGPRARRDLARRLTDYREKRAANKAQSERAEERNGSETKKSCFKVPECVTRLFAKKGDSLLDDPIIIDE